MNDKVDGEPKYVIARRVLIQVIDDIPDHFHVGFRVFGHMGFWGNKPGTPDYEDPGYYTDSELMVSIGNLREKNRRKLVKDWVNYLKPAGATPLVYSLLQARKDFPANWKGPKMVLLLSDGEENCGGKLEDVAKAYQGTGIDVIIHIVGLGVPTKEEQPLKEIARISGGYYSNTTNAQDLKAGLRKALRSTRFYVESTTGEKTFGLINGPALTMKAGLYQVGIPQTRVTPAQVRLEDGQAVLLSLDEAGGLTVSGVNRPAGSK
jgi:Ca-activated chloride channel family protein